MELSDTITKHVSYNATCDMQEICKPLLDNLNINLFSMSRYYSDGSCAHLTTCREALYHHITNKYPFCGTVIAPGTHLWNNYLPSKALRNVANLFDFHNGISFCNSKPHYLEVFNFAAPASNNTIVDFYFNNIDLLEQFLLYFQDKAVNLIKKTTEERLIVPKTTYSIKLNDKSYENLRNLIKPKKIYMNNGTSEIILSGREYEVLLQFAKGKITKEVAKTLNISHRTVEDHLVKVKNKSNYTFKSQLLDMLRDNALITNSTAIER